MAAVDDGARFDFVIVGAGAAGCVLANRLSEDPAVSVCLLEAGGPDTDFRTLMPAGALDLAARAGARNWGFRTVAQPHLEGRALFEAAGRGWGGSTAIGNMIALRGAPEDYDRWRTSGLTGWGFSDLLFYFRRAERFVGDADHFHGRAGPLYVTAPQSKNELFRAFVEAAQEAGYPRSRDFNGAQREGAGYFPLTIRDHQRSSAAHAYLRPIIGIRRNLSVLSNARAVRVEIEAGRADGVEYVSGLAARVRKSVKARRDVILAAGALLSPQILMLSGIGDGAGLAAMNIARVAHAPEVGRNLVDRLGAALTLACPLPLTYHAQAKALGALSVAAAYRMRRAGPGRFSFLEAGGLFKSRGDASSPDIEMHMLAAQPVGDGGIRPQEDGFSIIVSQTRPESRGSVQLKSPDPFETPLIDPNFLAAEIDRRALRDGVRMAREIAAKPGLAIYRGRELAPGTSVRTDAQTDLWIARTAQSLGYPLGTCRMGADADSVVDGALRVRGLGGLRVADSSVLPSPIGADPAITVIAIAEKAADIILGRAAGG